MYVYVCVCSLPITYFLGASVDMERRLVFS